LPSVNRLYADLEKKGLAVLLVAFREDAALVKRVARERGYVAPVLVDASGDVPGPLWRLGSTTSYVLDRQGRLLARLVGEHDWSTPATRRLIERVLERPS
jgi:hypothetical protein